MNCLKKIADHDCYKCPCSYIKNKKIHCGRCEYSNVLKTGKVSCMMPWCIKRGDIIANEVMS
jgi:hypothetical protein